MEIPIGRQPLSLRLSLGRRPTRRLLVIASVAMVALLTLAGAVGSQETGSEETGSEEAGPPTQDEIDALIANVWDQRMARQTGMALELPVREVAERLDILTRWSEALAAGGYRLPDGFAERRAEARRVLELAERDAETDLDPVLLFVEEGVGELRELIGDDRPPPTARGPSR